MKLLIFTDEFSPLDGGVGRYCNDLANEIHKKGHELVVLTMVSPHDIRSVNCNPFKVIKIPNTRFWQTNVLLGFLFFITSILRFHNYHILVTGYLPIQIISIISIACSLKFSLILHGTEILLRTRSKFRKWLFDLMCKKARSIITISEYTRSILLNQVNILEKKKLRVIYIGVNKKVFFCPVNMEKVLSLKKVLNIPEGKVVLTLARLDKRKGHDTVLSALSRVIAKIPNVTYLIVGHGPDKKRLEKLVSRYELQKHVFFLGAVPDNEIIYLYDMCDIFVMLSRQEKRTVEGFGIPFLEAAARGKPVIGGKHGGVPEVIIDGETGFLVEPNDDELLSKLIFRLLTNEKLARRMGKKGKARVFQDFTSETMAKRTIDVILISN